MDTDTLVHPIARNRHNDQRTVGPHFSEKLLSLKNQCLIYYILIAKGIQTLHYANPLQF